MDPNYSEKSSEFYEAVGRALSAWQPIEINLALLFVSVVGATHFRAAFAAFGAAVNFNVRMQMLDAAADATLEGAAAETFRDLTQKVRRASAKRNKLAHWMYNAVVDDAGRIDIFLADVRKGPVGPDESSVRLEDITQWVEEWNRLHVEVIDFLGIRAQPKG